MLATFGENYIFCFNNIDGFTGGLGFNPQMPAPFYEIKVLEGVSEHKNSLFSTKFSGASPQPNAELLT